MWSPQFAPSDPTSWHAGQVTVVGAFVLRDVQLVFISINNQWNLWNIAFINAKTGNATLRGPSSKMLGTFPQSSGKQFCLLLGFFVQLAERGVTRSMHVGFVLFLVVIGNRRSNILVCFAFRWLIGIRRGDTPVFRWHAPVIFGRPMDG